MTTATWVRVSGIWSLRGATAIVWYACEYECAGKGEGGRRKYALGGSYVTTCVLCVSRPFLIVHVDIKR